MHRPFSNAYYPERVAKLVAAFVTFGCLCFFILVSRPQKQPPRKLGSVPVTTSRSALDPPGKSRDPNQEFRSVPGRWAPVDFKHYIYGRHKFVDGRKVLLELKNGEFEYDSGDNGQSWFSLKDVYYFDVTGDLIPDAIVDISHVQCSYGSCDGGSDLIFIYQIDFEGRVTELFQYETGSYAYGCGLKSLTLARKEVSLELFGRCEPSAMNDLGPEKFMVKGLTYVAFWFSDKGFIETKLDHISTDLTDVTSYKPEIRINAEPANVIRP